MAALYNSLLSLHDAVSAFTDRSALFSRLLPLLASYNSEYGVILLHAHCTISSDELMLNDGTTTAPVRKSEAQEAYGDRWTAEGEAYEFRKSRVPPPPEELLEAFREIVGEKIPLGLYYAKDFQPDRVALESTIGNANHVKLVSAADFVDDGHYVQTAWIPNAEGPVVAAYCQSYCRAGSDGKCEWKDHRRMS